MSVLAEIIAGVKEDLAARKIPRSEIEAAAHGADPVIDALPKLREVEMAVIAEVKRSSPSKGALAAITDPAGLAEQYQEAGASVISVLTERRRFNGSLADLDSVRKAVTLPILRKDFMVDEYQFFEARAHGADLILLIVAGLSDGQLSEFAALTTELGMRALVEVHTHQELERALAISPEIVGINSRNLKTLEVDQRAFEELLPEIPSGLIKVAESGISTRMDVEFAARFGANAILVGEALVKAGDPKLAMRDLLGQR